MVMTVTAAAAATATAIVVMVRILAVFVSTVKGRMKRTLTWNGLDYDYHPFVPSDMDF